MIKKIYNTLLKEYGHQGWWPVQGRYNPKDYSYPKTEKKRFEICVGAILTQNTSWKQVEKALLNLKQLNAIGAKQIIKLNVSKLKQAIKAAGYFNQKAKKLKNGKKLKS